MARRMFLHEGERKVANAWCNSNGNRNANVGSVENDWNDNYWFAFRRNFLRRSLTPGSVPGFAFPSKSCFSILRASYRFLLEVQR